ncbi:MAG: AEC family transporter [Sedimentisphaerales bacterium]|nr:AEC family transporter [Sedimentisphaerales bacterium]
MKVFIIILAAGLLVRRRIVTQDQIKGLSVVTVNVFLPCLIFSNIIDNFRPDNFAYWWTLPLAATATILLGLLLGALVFLRELPAKKNMLALASVQNAGYLILPVGSALFSPAEFERFATYCFLYILAFNPLLWSIAKYLVTSQADEKITFRSLTTPPLLANIFALLLVFTGAYRLVPGVVTSSADLLGQATVPLANFILGAVLGSISLKIKPYFFDALKTLFIKLIAIPLISILVLYLFDLQTKDPLMAKFLVLQAAAAPATGLILQLRKYGGDEQKISNIMLLHYIACIFLMPTWMAVWSLLT